MYDTILLPTDGSEGSRVAVETAIEYAKAFDATLEVLYVIDERYVAGEYDMAVEDAEKRGEKALDEAATIAESVGVPVERHLRRGQPHEEILDAITDYGADVVVMGTHGRTGLDRFVHLGSVTERVVRHAGVDVVTVPIRTD